MPSLDITAISLFALLYRMISPLPKLPQVDTSLSESNRKAMEELMAAGIYEYQSDFAKTHQARGRAEGEALGRVEALLAVLDARGLIVSETDRARVLACTDAATLDRMIRKAVTVSSVDALFE